MRPGDAGDEATSESHKGMHLALVDGSSVDFFSFAAIALFNCHPPVYNCLFAMRPTYSLSLFVTSLASVVSLRIDSQSLSNTSPPNTAPPTLPRVSSLKGDGDCFDASAHPRLIPAQMEDCRQAALLIQEIGQLTRPVTLSRHSRGNFPLPQVFRSGTCVITVDVVHDADSDRFPLWVVNNAALDLAGDCVERSFHVGGKKFVGPNQIVYVMIFGRNPPPPPTGGGTIQLVPSITNNVTLEVA